MRRLFEQYDEWILVIAAFFMIAILAAYFIWGVRTLLVDVNMLTSSPSEEGEVSNFNIEGAKALNLSGGGDVSPSKSIPGSTQ